MKCEAFKILQGDLQAIVFSSDCPDREFCLDSGGDCCLSKAASCFPVENPRKVESIFYVYVLKKMLEFGEIKAADKGTSLFLNGLYELSGGSVSPESILDAAVISFLWRKKISHMMRKKNVPALIG